ncbi:elongator complex protein 6-like [Ylistrum balloti]|uniref:elongator complex protein 6-like n=1 Tax=Ylistrum balloti TaxID=509963 RepID=UPI002905D7C7|nr:elongator complex protein 6-like [Ylistrum balloti]
MFPELNSVLNIKTCDSIIGKSITISESDVDGQFLIHHFLSFFLRNEHPVCLMTLAQSFNHFNTVSKKFGLDLTSKRNNGQLAFVEGLKLLGESFMLDDRESDVNKGDNPFVENGKFSNVLSPLHYYIENICNGMMKDTSKPPVLVVDDISVLLSTGHTLKDVIALVYYLQNFISKCKGTLILHINKGKESCDEDAVQVWKHMCHLFPLQIEVCGLNSGYCRDVHGEIKFAVDSFLNKHQVKKTMQYKLTDKSIALFAAGLSSAVL